MLLKLAVTSKLQNYRKNIVKSLYNLMKTLAIKGEFPSKWDPHHY